MRRMVCGAAGLLLAASLMLAACGDDGGGGSATDFCSAAAGFEQANQAPNPSTGSPDELKASFGMTKEALDEMVATAPEEIKDDVVTMRDTFVAFFDAFAAHDYDYTKLIADPDGLAAADALSSEEMATAGGAVEAYVAEHCATTTTG